MSDILDYARVLLHMVLIDWGIAFVIAVVILAILAKELVYDKKLGLGTPEWRDVFWGLVGPLFGLL